MKKLFKWLVMLVFLFPCLFLFYGCFVWQGRFSLSGFWEVWKLRDVFFNFFQNSMILTVPVVFLQLLICIPAAYGFSQWKNRMVQVLFALYLLSMLMPFLVTMIPAFLLMQKLGLIGKFAAVILPKTFAVFGVFFLKQTISAVPDSILEAARLDGCGEWRILANIIVPLLKPSIFALTIMIFADCWSMVEEPLILLQDMTKFPLSVFLDSEVQDVTQSTFIISLGILLVPISFYWITQKQLLAGVGVLLEPDDV